MPTSSYLGGGLGSKSPTTILPSPCSWSFTRTKSGHGVSGLAIFFGRITNPPLPSLPGNSLSAFFCLLFQFTPLMTASSFLLRTAIKIPERGLENLPRNRRKCSSCLCNKGSSQGAKSRGQQGQVPSHTKGARTGPLFPLCPPTLSLPKRRLPCACVSVHVSV